MHVHACGERTARTALDAIEAAVAATGRGCLVLVGSETPICIAQTALMALERGMDVVVLADCVTARGELDHDVTSTVQDQLGNEIMLAALTGRDDSTMGSFVRGLVMSELAGVGQEAAAGLSSNQVMHTWGSIGTCWA